MFYTIYNSRMAVPIFYDISVFGFVSGPNNRINIQKFENSRKQNPEKTRSISLELIFTGLEDYI